MPTYVVEIGLTFCHGIAPVSSAIDATSGSTSPEVIRPSPYGASIASFTMTLPLSVSAGVLDTVDVGHLSLPPLPVSPAPQQQPMSIPTHPRQALGPPAHRCRRDSRSSSR